MKFLVTTDGSARSLTALPHAAAAARACAGSIILLRVLDPRKEVRRGHEQSAHEATREAVAARTAELKATLETFALDGEARVEVLRSGDRVHEAILRVAAELGAAMIAIASRGAGGLRRTLLGSVAVRVINGSAVPVMVTGSIVKRASTRRRYSIILCIEKARTLAAAARAVAPLTASGARLIVLQVYVPALGDRGSAIEIAASLERLKAAAATALPGTPARLMVERAPDFTHVEEAVMEIALSLKVDAIAVLSRRLSTGLRSLVTPSLTERLLEVSTLPVIIAGKRMAGENSKS